MHESPKAAKAKLGYLPEGAPAYGEMTPRSFLAFIAEVRGFTGSAIKARVAAAADRAGLNAVLDQRIETLSKGFKRRVGIAQAILHDPPVLIMDEPTDGLDPNQKHHVRELIREMAADKGDHRLDAYPGRGRGGLHARRDHQQGAHRRRRHGPGSHAARAQPRRGHDPRHGRAAQKKSPSRLRDTRRSRASRGRRPATARSSCARCRRTARSRWPRSAPSCATGSSPSTRSSSTAARSTTCSARSPPPNRLATHA